MEIEGIINHTLEGLELKKHNYDLLIMITMQDKVIWETLRDIHNNAEIQEAIKDIREVRELFGRTQYMKEFLSNDWKDTFKFRGFHFEHLQLYIELRESCKNNEMQE